MRISASELVPGDVVRIVVGDRVAADLRVVEADGLVVDESLLSGVGGGKAEKHDDLSKHCKTNEHAEHDVTLIRTLVQRQCRTYHRSE